MNILYLLDQFPKISETFILNEIIALKQSGHTVLVAAHGQENGKAHEAIQKHGLREDTIYPSNTPDFSGYQNGRQKILDFIRRFLTDFIKHPLGTIKIVCANAGISSNIWVFLDNYLLARQLQGRAIDLVHAPYTYLRHLELAVLLSDLLHVPLSCTLRDFEPCRARQIAKKARFMKKVSRLVAISRYNKMHSMSKFGIKTGVEIIHDSIDMDQFRPAKAGKAARIICLCRFVEQKGVEDLLNAGKILKSRRRYFELRLIGSGPLKSRYEELIKGYDLCASVTIKGPLTQGEIKEELDEAMVFVLPCVIAQNGERDILPNVLKEAMAMEIPVITSDICGIEELVEHEVNGLLIPSQNPTAIADAIERLFDDRALRERLGRKAREKIENEFNIEKESKKVEAVFKKAAGAHQP